MTVALAAMALAALAGRRSAAESAPASSPASFGSAFRGVDPATGRPCLEVPGAEGYDVLHALAFTGKGLGTDVKERCDGPLEPGLPEGMVIELRSTTPPAVERLVLEGGRAKYRGLISTAMELEPGHETRVGRLLGWGKGRTLWLAKGAKLVAMRLRAGPVSWLYVTAQHDRNGPAVTIEASAALGRGLCAWPFQDVEAIWSRDSRKGRIVRDVYTPL